MYGELIVGINMVFNYVILSFANRMVKAQATRLRLLLASLAGALPVAIFPDSRIAIFIAFGLMIICAFGMSMSSIGNPAVIVLIGALFAGGALTVFTEKFMSSDSKATVFISALLAYLFLYLFKTKWMDVRVARRLSSFSVASELSIWNETISIPCFIDTGNRCIEPMSGDPVHFVSLKFVERSIPEDLKGPLLSCNTKEMPQLSVFPTRFQKSLRLIRLQTVQGASWAVGFKFDRWIIAEGSELPPGYIVLTKQDNRYPEGAGAIMHASALESISNERGTSHVAGI
ncbi:sigma-E processing peptidase SpoIIGA [Sporosarcina sp. ACRSL]|uniref:sigma-E processing peptidase SpoIIGA n=1 Tax=Sporosarcina sp. ACRSL TaxID=2918215 RepID=UPI001EF42D53|nr:sigma-E processing peptidase SpoIIGA [Sporosarcina sp. ACRSL]MCG7342790.1 sigma-E processing peptidase SpoIIGA [Sporosarcina sp. ACRSL]